MEFRILGPLEVGGEPFRGSPKQRALLVSLLLARGSPVSTERLLDAVWGDRPPASAAHALQVYVSELRKAGVAVEREGAGYRLRPEPLDAAEFEDQLENARAHRGSSRHEDALASLDAALALWRGPALAGLDDGDAATERERLEDLRVAALEDRAESVLALGRTLDLTELEPLVAEHPLRERLRGLLMLGLYRGGRQAEALDAYAGIRSALDELGLEPGAELRALQGAILRQDAALDVEPESLRERRHLPAPATSFVGRRAEVDDITALLRGDSRVVTLTGPGGAGKTRVALRSAHELAGAFADGVWFVGLAALVDPALVRPAIAQALGLAEETLEDELGGRELAPAPGQLRAAARSGPARRRVAAGGAAAAHPDHEPRASARCTGSTSSCCRPCPRPTQRSSSSDVRAPPAGPCRPGRSSPRSAAGSTDCRSRSSSSPPARPT